MASGAACERSGVSGSTVRFADLLARGQPTNQLPFSDVRHRCHRRYTSIPRIIRRRRGDAVIKRRVLRRPYRPNFLGQQRRLHPLCLSDSTRAYAARRAREATTPAAAATPAPKPKPQQPRPTLPRPTANDAPSPLGPLDAHVSAHVHPPSPHMAPQRQHITPPPIAPPRDNAGGRGCPTPAAS